MLILVYTFGGLYVIDVEASFYNLLASHDDVVSHFNKMHARLGYIEEDRMVRLA